MPASDDAFPPGFFARSDAGDDDRFYAPPRLVTHIDDRAIAAVGELYEELEVSGDVLDLMGSWVSHFRTPPRHLTVLGMNEVELAANPQAAATTVHDLNVDSRLPFADATFDDVVCCVSVDYLVEPVAVFRDVARVLRPGGRFVCTFSNRCFPTKAIRGWLMASDEQRVEIVAKYFRLAQGWEEPVVETRLHAGGAGSVPNGGGGSVPNGGAGVFGFGDPLFAVWSRSVHSSS